MCSFNFVYRDLNLLILNLVRINVTYKTEVATIFTDVTDFEYEQKITSAS